MQAHQWMEFCILQEDSHEGLLKASFFFHFPIGLSPMTNHFLSSIYPHPHPGPCPILPLPWAVLPTSHSPCQFSGTRISFWAVVTWLLLWPSPVVAQLHMTAHGVHNAGNMLWHWNTHSFSTAPWWDLAPSVHKQPQGQSRKAFC